MDAVVWILVDHSSRATAFSSVAEKLSTHNIQTEILTITEVLGNTAKDAFTGSAERLIRGLRVAVKGRVDEDFVGAVQKAKPDLIVITHARYVRALSLLKSVSGSEAIQVGVCTDYNFSDAWQKSSIQAFVVPHDSFRQYVTHKGIPKERTVIAGPPIQASFERPLVQDEERAKFNFEKNEKVVLVRSNGFDTSTLDKLVFQSTLVDISCRYLFHHDGDGATATTLRTAAAKYGVPALMFGKVPDLERYIVAADIVVSAPNEAYISEIIALDKPTVFVGTDDENAQQVEFLDSLGATGHIPDVLRFGGTFDNFLKDEFLKSSTSAAATLSTQRANEGVANALLAILEQSKQWTDNLSPNSDPTPQDLDSPFESIGDAQEKNSAFIGISKAEAKEQLAGLILAERDIERKLSEIEKQQDRWRKRLQMARDMEEEDLANDAEGVLRDYIEEGSQIQKELKSILIQKSKLKAHAGTGAARKLKSSDDTDRIDEMERKFRKMEIDSDLDSLKDRIKRELGE